MRAVAHPRCARLRASRYNDVAIPNPFPKVISEVRCVVEVRRDVATSYHSVEDEADVWNLQEELWLRLLHHAQANSYCCDDSTQRFKHGCYYASVTINEVNC